MESKKRSARDDGDIEQLLLPSRKQPRGYDFLRDKFWDLHERLDPMMKEYETLRTEFRARLMLKLPTVLLQKVASYLGLKDCIRLSLCDRHLYHEVVYGDPCGPFEETWVWPNKVTKNVLTGRGIYMGNSKLVKSILATGVLSTEDIMDVFGHLVTTNFMSSEQRLQMCMLFIDHFKKHNIKYCIYEIMVQIVSMQYIFDTNRNWTVSALETIGSFEPSLNTSTLIEYHGILKLAFKSYREDIFEYFLQLWYNGYKTLLKTQCDDDLKWKSYMNDVINKVVKIPLMWKVRPDKKKYLLVIFKTFPDHNFSGSFTKILQNMKTSDHQTVDIQDTINILFECGNFELPSRIYHNMVPKFRKNGVYEIVAPMLLQKFPHIVDHNFVNNNSVVIVEETEDDYDDDINIFD